MNNLDKKMSEKFDGKIYLEKLSKKKRWEDVLDRIYMYFPHKYTRRITELHPLIKDLSMSEDELALCISFIEDNGLIRLEDEWIDYTEKGFNVILEYRKYRSNYNLAMAAFILSIASLLISFFALIKS